MHIFISCDVEGLNGVVHSSQTQPNEALYANTVKLLHAEVNQVIEGLLESDVNTITVADAHWDMRNLQLETLNPKASLISGSPRNFSMMAQIDQLKPDGIIMLGYHSKIGTADGVLAHTYRAKVFKDVQVNNISVGELGLNALLASHFRIPIILITGDNALEKEANKLLGKVNFHLAKQALNKYAAIFKPYSQNLTELKENTKLALKNQQNWVQLTKIQPPYELKISFFCPSMADGACLIKDVIRVSDDTISFTDNIFPVVFKMLLAIGAIGSTRINNYF